ncbi:Uncharacterised protein [Vibrio cholerae]|nr:Uncharacterised protein [Vibrio cholerae]CSB95613.1 Uncharacterised protein [Vibrio cholerae]CSC10337.1 Uncharacterised protein [Vibrio cholerae]CSC86942.1 Uncharacterised protein [Vibrio cholerae]
MYRIIMLIGLTFTGFQCRMGQKCGQHGHLLRFFWLFKLARRRHQLFQVFNPRFGFFAFFLLIHLQQTRGFYRVVREHMQRHVDAFLFQGVDQFNKAAQRARSTPSEHLVIEQTDTGIPQGAATIARGKANGL